MVLIGHPGLITCRDHQRLQARRSMQLLDGVTRAVGRRPRRAKSTLRCYLGGKPR
jgi:hypothetical protein